MTNISIDEIKKKIENKEMEIGIYTGKNGEDKEVILIVDVDKFATHTKQNNGWSRVEIYEYDRTGNTWVDEETYEKE